MELADGSTVMISVPMGFFAVLSGIPSLYLLPSMEMLEGVALDNVACPKLILILKSLASSAPLPPLVLKTASLNVSSTVLLSEASSTALK